MIRLTTYIILSFLLFLGCKNETTNGGPSIILLNKVHHFGTINLNDSLNYTFKLINNSKVELKITKVGTQCDCTTSYYSESKIGYLDTAKIVVKFKPTNLGVVNKSIVVETTSIPPFNVFYLKGNVVKD